MSIAAYIEAVQREAAKVWFVVVFDGAGGTDQFAEPASILDTAATFASVPSVTGIRVCDRGGWCWYREDYEQKETSMATEIVNLRNEDGSLIGTAEIDSADGEPTLLEAGNGAMYVRDSLREYVAAIPVAVIVKPRGTE